MRSINELHNVAHPACGLKGSTHLSPVHAYEFLSRCRYSTPTFREPMAELLVLTLSATEMTRWYTISYSRPIQTHPIFVPCHPTGGNVVQLPPDKKKKGKGKSKGKGNKKHAEGGAGAGVSSEFSRTQEALSAFGWEVSELLRAMSTPLKVREQASTSNKRIIDLSIHFKLKHCDDN